MKGSCFHLRYVQQRWERLWQEPVLHSEGRSIDGLANHLFSTESQGNHADMIYERGSRYNASSVSKVLYLRYWSAEPRGAFSKTRPLTSNETAAFGAPTAPHLPTASSHVARPYLRRQHLISSQINSPINPRPSDEASLAPSSPSPSLGNLCPALSPCRPCPMHDSRALKRYTVLQKTSSR